MYLRRAALLVIAIVPVAFAVSVVVHLLRHQAFDGFVLSPIGIVALVAWGALVVGFAVVTLRRRGKP